MPTECPPWGWIKKVRSLNWDSSASDLTHRRDGESPSSHLLQARQFVKGWFIMHNSRHSIYGWGIEEPFVLCKLRCFDLQRHLCNPCSFIWYRKSKKCSRSESITSWLRSNFHLKTFTRAGWRWATWMVRAVSSSADARSSNALYRGAYFRCCCCCSFNCSIHKVRSSECCYSAWSKWLEWLSTVGFSNDDERC